ncbi:hypothetical protein [Sphingobium olei]|uniref:Uncharacterized protein n=1 Tax=Sphingobium olei TaxID=420955 RepID=A0ABW3P4R6_9SPHN
MIESCNALTLAHCDAVGSRPPQHGTSGYIPAGTVVNGQLNSDLRFRYAAQSAPVAVASATDR